MYFMLNLFTKLVGHPWINNLARLFKMTMNKKTLIPIIALLILTSASGTLWYLKVRNSQSQFGQSENEESYYDEGVVIKTIDYSTKEIIGVRTAVRKGTVVKLDLKDTKVFYDKNDQIVPLSYFKVGMIITARGNGLIREPDIFYPDWIKEWVLNNKDR